MDTSIYLIGDKVAFHGDSKEENDRGTVVEIIGDEMRVYWEVARETHTEDRYDNRIALISREFSKRG